MNSAKADIAVVGGGLMGATIALLFARAMPECQIVLCEKFTVDTESPVDLGQPSFDGRSTALSPTSVDLLRTLDLWPNLPGTVTPIRRIHVSDRGHLGWVSLQESDNNNLPLGFVVENRALGWSLNQGLLRQSNIQIKAPALVENIAFSPGGAILRWRDQAQPLTVSLAVVADGADSPLRQSLGIQASRKDYQQHAMVANVRCSQPHQAQAFERFTSRGPLAMLPLHGNSGRHVAMVWTWPASEQQSAMALSDSEFLSQLQAIFGYRLGEFCAISPRSSYPLQLVLAQEQVRRNLVLMGNAAHFLHPVAGQGYNLALRDALRLTEILAQTDRRSLGELDVLQHYQRQQADDQNRTRLLSDGFIRLFGSDHVGAAALRNCAMFGVQCQPWIRSVFIRHMSGRGSDRAQPWGSQ